MLLLDSSILNILLMSFQHIENKQSLVQTRRPIKFFTRDLDEEGRGCVPCLKWSPVRLGLSETISSECSPLAIGGVKGRFGPCSNC